MNNNELIAVSPKYKILWQLRIALVMLVLYSAAFFLLYFNKIVFCCVILFFLLIHIVIAFIYIPWSYKRLKYVYNNNCVERHIGIIFHRITVLSLDKIQYASIFQTPLQKTMAVADLVISVSGGIIILPCLEWERAVYIKNGICHTVPEIVNGNKK